MQFSERSESVWKTTAPVERPAPLEGSIETEVCIVGAGIAGMTTAYLLARAGRRVVVLSDSAVGGGETGQTTAHLASAIDDRFLEIERLHGDSGAKTSYQSHAQAIDRIASIVDAEQIECELRRVDGYLFLGGDHQPASLLRRELAAARRAGFEDAELLPRVPLPYFDTGPCLRFPRQGQLHPLKYLAGLAAAVRRDGGLLFTDSHVTRCRGGEPALVETSSGARVTAAAVVVATNSPVNDRVRVHSKQAPFRTYVIGLRVPSGSIPWALYWDTLDPYHYVRLASGPDGDDVLVVGGEDHRTGEASDAAAVEERWARLERWARERFPTAGALEHRWSGQVMEPFDGVAFIGRNPLDARNVLIATGDSGQGMTHGTIAGILLSEMLQGRPHAWEQLYDPSRKTLRALGEYVRDNLEVAKHLVEHLRGGEVDAPYEIRAGEGAIVQRGGRKLAVYRTGTGMLVQRSAVCTHLGCLVHWNSAEKSWDCPCHGSRFAPSGEVLSGPAVAPLRGEPPAKPTFGWPSGWTRRRTPTAPLRSAAPGGPPGGAPHARSTRSTRARRPRAHRSRGPRRARR
jgi:glycine/D-amino acid oxidase-like deaminating enzyme/nitrite reductase/ring-hydroxylating ferredoxin subunit